MALSACRRPRPELNVLGFLVAVYSPTPWGVIIPAK